MTKLTDNLTTPFFLINKEILDNGISKLRLALNKAWPHYIIGYSYKTNALQWIIKYFNEQSCYAEVVSDDEYNLAKTIGINKKHVIYNGIAKSKETFLEAIKNQAIVNIDAEYEIDWLDDLNTPNGVQYEKKQYEVGIRVNFDLEKRCPGHSQCPEDGGRFGFCYENGELKRAIDKIEKKGIKVVGIHLHKSSKTRMPDVYKAIAEVAVEIGKKYSLDLSYIDIGGGFFGGLETKPKFPEYFNMVADILKNYFDPQRTSLIVEPGNALIASPIDYHTTVLDVKKGLDNIFVIINGSRTQIDPLMTKKSYFYEILKKGYGDSISSGTIRNTIAKQIISGFTCMEHDRLFELYNYEQLIPGDRIVFEKVGAYTMCLTPLFIKWFPDVYLLDGDNLIKLREHWDSSKYNGNINNS